MVSVLSEEDDQKLVGDETKHSLLNLHQDSAENHAKIHAIWKNRERKRKKGGKFMGQNSEKLDVPELF